MQLRAGKTSATGAPPTIIWQNRTCGTGERAVSPKLRPARQVRTYLDVDFDDRDELKAAASEKGAEARAAVGDREGLVGCE